MLTKLLNLIAKSERIEQTTIPAHDNRVSVVTYTIGTTQLEIYNGVVKVLHDGLEIGFLTDNVAEEIRHAIWDRQASIKSECLKMFLAS